MIMYENVTTQRILYIVELQTLVNLGMPFNWLIVAIHKA